MKIIFHEKFYNSEYTIDPATSLGRLDEIIKIIKSKLEIYEIITPESAKDEDILRAHTHKHLDYIKKIPLLFKLSALAVGGAIQVAEEAYKKNPSFGVIRPPGHHVSADSSWGFCYFNNMSISLLKLFSERKIKSAFILDFDLHFGDGTVNIFSKKKKQFQVDILNPNASDRVNYIKQVKEYLERLKNIDIFAISAGFDQRIDDWGNLLYPEDFKELGYLIKTYSDKLCQSRRYAILEGGYNHSILGTNVDSFCQGFM